MSETVNTALVSRRRFLTRLSGGLGALAAAVLGVPLIAYLLSPLINPAQNVWRSIATVDQVGIGQTIAVTYLDPSPLPWAGQTARTALWLRRSGPETFTAFVLNCSHLGCPVDWKPDAQLFLCPCHGGVYYADGTVAAGPPPLPLARYQLRLVNGDVQILTQPTMFGAQPQQARSVSEG